MSIAAPAFPPLVEEPPALAAVRERAVLAVAEAAGDPSAGLRPALARAGLLGLGSDLDTACVVLEELAAATGLHALALVDAVLGPAALAGLPAAASRHVAAALDGPQAGAPAPDLGPDAGGRRLRGTAVAHGAAGADLLLVACREPDGLGLALVEASAPGVRTSAAPLLTGPAADRGLIELDGVPVAAAARLAPDAAAAPLARLAGARRCAAAAIALGQARALLEHAIAGARQAGPDGRERCEAQPAQWAIADLAAAVDAARLLLATATAADAPDGAAAAARVAAGDAAALAIRVAPALADAQAAAPGGPVARALLEVPALEGWASTLDGDRDALAGALLAPGTGPDPAAAGRALIGPRLSGPAEDVRRRSAAVAELIRPHARTWDVEESYPESSLAALAEAGLLGLTMPTRYGGEGLGVLEACVVLEELASACMSTAMVAQMFLNGPPRAILELGTREQADHYLPGCVTGERSYSIAISEPQAGSSATELQTRLDPDGDGFLLNGGKCYITGGMRSNTFLVFCRLAGTSGSRGIGAVVVERAQRGFASPHAQPKMGGRGVGEAVLTFDDVRIDPSAVILAPDPASSRGAAVMLKQFNPERCGNAAMSIGVARGALSDSLGHLHARRQFGRPLADFQGLRRKVAQMGLLLQAARALTHRAAASDEDGFPRTRWTAMAKVHANEAAKLICDEAIQLHGHQGYTRDLPVERYFRDARGLGLGGGTTEIMRNVLAGEILGRRFSQR